MEKNNFNRVLFTAFIIYILAVTFEFIGCLIYLELVELRCFELNKNTKLNIIRRSFRETDNDFLNETVFKVIIDYLKVLLMRVLTILIILGF